MCFPLQKMTNKSALWTHCSAAPTAGRSVSYPNNWPSCALNWLCQCSPVSKQTGILKQFATNNSQHILFCLLLFIQQQISFHLHSSINLNVPFTMYSYKSFIMSLFACFVFVFFVFCRNDPSLPDGTWGCARPADTMPVAMAA